MPQWLQWDQDRAELRLDASALASLNQTQDLSSTDGFTRKLNYTLIHSSEGFSLVTLMHKALLPWHPASDVESHSERDFQPGMDKDFVPMLASSVSFGGDSMHRLHRDFVNMPDQDLRERVVAIHFHVLESIVSSLPRVISRRIQRFRAMVKQSRLFSLLLSVATLLPSLPLPWLRSHQLTGATDSPVIALIPLLIWIVMPWLAHQGLRIDMRYKARSLQNRWKREANQRGV